MSDALLRALESRWHAEIPISATMGIRVDRFDGVVLEASAALGPNTNVHGTAFAGSQFSLAALCGWGQVWLQLALAAEAETTADPAGQSAGRTTLSDSSIVFVEGHIRCLAPVDTDMVASCAWTDDAAAALAKLAVRDRTRVLLIVALTADGRIAAEFRGEYGVRRRQ